MIRVTEAGDVSPGEMRVVDVAGTRVTIANVDGHLYAFEDRCTHRGCSLASGELDGTLVTCACHGSQFDVTSGAVLRGPAQRPVRSFGLSVQDDQILVETPGAD